MDRKRVRLIPGDITDGNGLFELIQARSFFLEALNRVAPECLVDLDQTLSAVTTVVEVGHGEGVVTDVIGAFPGSNLVAVLTLGSDEEIPLPAEVDAWAARWNLDQAKWIRTRSTISWVVYRQDLADFEAGRSTVSEPRPFSISYTSWGVGMTADDIVPPIQLDLLFRGGQVPFLTVQVQAKVDFSPFTERFEDIRQAIVESVAEQLDRYEEYFAKVFSDVKSSFDSYSEPHRKEIQAEYFDWYVYRLTHKEPLSQSAKRFNVQRSTMRDGIKTVSEILKFPIPGE